MKLPLYRSDFKSEDIKLPRILNGIIKFYHHPLHPHYCIEDIPKIRKMEMKSSQGLLGRVIYGKKIVLNKIENIIIQNNDVSIPVRIYQAHEGDFLPVILFFHGGGYVQGSVDIYDRFCRSLAKDLDAIIVSVDYRLAPETTYPGAVDDCYGSTKWVFSNIAEKHGDPQKIYLMGDSAGGGLAAIIAQEARGDPEMKLAGQILLYPWVDLLLTQKSIDTNDGYIISKKLADVFTEAYLPEKHLKSSPNVSPIYAEELNNLPPSLVITGSHDPLRDEGREYAKLLKDAGNQVIYKNYLQTFHGFLSAKGVMPRGKQMYQDFIQTIKSQFIL